MHPQAKVVDVLRSAQRDEHFVNEMQDSLQSLLKLLGARNYHSLRRITPGVTNTWYYFMTTLGNLQTLGEEYTGTLRVNSNGRIPSKTVELLWLCLYIGGEPLIERLVSSWKQDISTSSSLTNEAKQLFLKILGIFQDHKVTLKRIHHCLFYINGKYYNISNRITGIKYVLVRQWLQDDTFTNSFKVLGHISLFYILFSSVQQIWSSRISGNVPENQQFTGLEITGKTCALCAEGRKNPCATPCGHVFCWDCIFDSLSYQQSCPVCREVVIPSRVMLLQNYV